MGKRSDYERNPRDLYPTPLEAVLPLRGNVLPYSSFFEPCAGDGRLVKWLEETLKLQCFGATDIEPQNGTVIQLDANNLTQDHVEYCDLIITNPPFAWNMLKPLLDKFISLRPTLLLLPADFMHNKRMGSYMEICESIISIGRVKWIEGSKTAGVDNYAWYLFDKEHTGKTTFIGR